MNDVFHEENSLQGPEVREKLIALAPIFSRLATLAGQGDLGAFHALSRRLKAFNTAQANQINSSGQSPKPDRDSSELLGEVAQALSAAQGVFDLGNGSETVVDVMNGFFEKE